VRTAVDYRTDGVNTRPTCNQMVCGSGEHPLPGWSRAKPCSSAGHHAGDRLSQVVEVGRGLAAIAQDALAEPTPVQAGAKYTHSSPTLQSPATHLSSMAASSGTSTRSAPYLVFRSGFK